MTDWKERNRLYRSIFYSMMPGLLSITDESANIRFEVKADLFYRRFGHLPPGKSDPSRTGAVPEEEIRATWEAYQSSGVAECDMAAEIERLKNLVKED